MEELQRGFPLLLQQYKALILKNLLLSWRNKRSTFLQLFSSLFFLLLIFLIQQATVSRYGSSSYFKTVTDPKPLVAPPIPACEEKHYTRLPCFDFVWSGNGSARIREIVRRIRENNPGRPIPLEKVKAFSTRNETDDWLASNPMYCPGALHFIDRNATVISYGLQTNSTPLAKRGNFEDPTFKFQIPLQLAAEREIARSLIGDASFSWVVTLKEFAHPALEIFSAMQDSGPTFFLAIAMFSFVFQISALVTEKELKLRQTGFAFMLSAFISKSSSSTTVGFFIFIIGFFTQLVTTSGFPYGPGFSNTYRIVWSLFPPNLLAAGLKLLLMQLQLLKTLNYIYKWLVQTSCVWFVLAIYFDNIFPNTSGVRKSLLYFLNPWYWIGKGGNKWEEGSMCSCLSSVPPSEDIVPDDEDVQEEESIVKQQAAEGNVNSSIAVQIRGLVKTYAGVTKIGCCKCKRTSPYHALKGIWLNFPKDQLFCLLGPNGAGKTTAINCLTGITPVTGGDALIYGNSIRSSSGMSNIRRMIGVCPQFDILWDALSGEEHLSLFASIKGLAPAWLSWYVAQKLLAEVKLTDDAKHLDVLPKEESKSFLTFVIPQEKEKLLKNFSLSSRIEKKNWYSRHPTWPNNSGRSFSDIAKKAELEKCHGLKEPLQLLLWKTLECLFKARFVSILRTESKANPRVIMVEVYWQQDDSGALCISGHSEEIDPSDC
ncbi:hypothetical protein DH2020_019454 [Rehmannia glutinosa]|uniref:ABC transporter domain-containing protein n=1 Tax=Rehmannia glutinosa TaxID=99300 RepID=A0ABR0WQD5_REHGL